MRPTGRLRWYRRREYVGIVQDGPAEGNKMFEPGPPVLQQEWMRTDSEIDQMLRMRGQVVPKFEWCDVPEVTYRDEEEEL